MKLSELNTYTNSYIRSVRTAIERYKDQQTDNQFSSSFLEFSNCLIDKFPNYKLTNKSIFNTDIINFFESDPFYKHKEYKNTFPETDDFKTDDFICFYRGFGCTLLVNNTSSPSPSRIVVSKAEFVQNYCKSIGFVNLPIYDEDPEKEVVFGSQGYCIRLPSTSLFYIPYDFFSPLYCPIGIEEYIDIYLEGGHRVLNKKFKKVSSVRSLPDDLSELSVEEILNRNKFN